jgi:hypothetical protein
MSQRGCAHVQAIPTQSAAHSVASRDAGPLRAARNVRAITSVMHCTRLGVSSTDTTPLKGFVMNRKTLAPCVTMLLMAAASAGALAQTAMPKTREQVRQELIEAVRNGSIARGELDASMNAMPMAASRARAEVRAEFEAARQNGDLLADGESSLKLNELHPSQYPQRTALAGKTRAQVLAELAEAQRTGDIVAAGESGLKLNETHPGLYPRAAMPVFASAPASPATR